MNNALKNRLIALRRHLHKYPELSGREEETADYILKFLTEYSPDKIVKGLGGNGLAAIYESTLHGKTVLIRCEMDALPIDEPNTFAYRSSKPEISHKCGHDGHMAIVCGIAATLSAERPKYGKVILLFQPAEETGAGAASVLKDKRMEQMKPDFAFALHNLPGYTLGQVVVKPDVFSASVHSMIIILQGKTAHAGEPHMGTNPSVAMAEIIRELQILNVADQRSDDFCMVTPVYALMGEKAYGVSAGRAEIHFSLRCWSNSKMADIESNAKAIAERIGSAHHLDVSIGWTDRFYANVNSQEAVSLIEKAAGSCEFQTVWKDVPFSWGEDFGLFTEKYEGAMFGLGAGDYVPPLHSAHYDFPDELIPIGVKMFHALIKQTNDG